MKEIRVIFIKMYIIKKKSYITKFFFTRARFGLREHRRNKKIRCQFTDTQTFRIFKFITSQQTETLFLFFVTFSLKLNNLAQCVAKSGKISSFFVIAMNLNKTGNFFCYDVITNENTYPLVILITKRFYALELIN